MLRFSCPHCEQTLLRPASEAGKTLACPRCQRRIQVPAGPASEEDRPLRIAPEDRDEDDEPDGDEGPDEQREPDELVRLLPDFSARLNELHVDAAEKPDGDLYFGADEGLELPERSVKELGKKLGTHRPDLSGPILLMVLGGILVLGAFACIGLAIALRAPAYLVGTLLGLGLGVLIILATWGQFTLRISVYQGGWVQSRWGRKLVLAWRDANCVYQQIVITYINGNYSGTTHLFTVVLRDGSRLTYGDSIRKVRKLGDLLFWEINRAVFARAYYALEAGSKVHFGRLAVSRKGIHGDGRLLRWEEFDRAPLYSGIVYVRKLRKRRPWCKVALPDFPNALVFLVLVDVARKMAKPARRSDNG